MTDIPASNISHRGIIDRADGSASLARKIGADPNTVKAWKRLDSIPAPHWAGIADAGVATLEELASAAARRASTPEQVAA